MIRFALRLAPVALALATGACFATRSDVRILQDDLTKFRTSQQAADSARAAQLAQVTATLTQVNDSLRATSARMGRWQANAQGDIRNIQEQLVQIQELTGASQQRLLDLRRDLEEKSAPPPTPNPAVPGDTTQRRPSCPRLVRRLVPQHSTSSRSTR